MQIFICTTPQCGYIGQFKQNQPYEMKTVACPKCTKTGQWKIHAGFIAPTILDNEDKKAAVLGPQVDQAKLTFDQCKRDYEAAVRTRDQLQFKYERAKNIEKDQFEAMGKALEDANKLLVKTTNELNDARTNYESLNDKLTDLGQRDAVRKDAPKAYDMANRVQQTSTKNKLYIGSRQYVSNHARSGQKKLRILDVPNWSPGLNVSWVEGGIAAKAHFKLKLNQGEQYSDIPNTVLQEFRDHPQMDPADFFALCKQHGPGSLLWFDRDNASRPTWTALEIWCLLRAGYQFTFADSAKDGPGRKIVLIPPV